MACLCAGTYVWLFQRETKGTLRRNSKRELGFPASVSQQILELVVVDLNELNLTREMCFDVPGIFGLPLCFPFDHETKRVPQDTKKGPCRGNDVLDAKLEASVSLAACGNGLPQNTKAQSFGTDLKISCEVSCTHLGSESATCLPEGTTPCRAHFARALFQEHCHKR